MSGAVSSAVLAAAILLPAATGAVLLVAGRRTERAAAGIAIVAAGVTAVLASASAIGRASLTIAFLPAGSTAALRVDALAAAMLPAVVVVALLVLVFARGDGTRPAARLNGFLLVFTAAVIVTVVATDLAVLLAAWEVMGATSYALIGFEWRQQARVSDGGVAFLVTRTGDLGLYLAAGAALAAGTGWRLDLLSDADSPWLHVIAAGVLAAGLGKAAQLPFSYWLSHAMSGPSAVSALLHSAAMVAMGGYLLLRMQPVLAASGWAGPTAAGVGAATAIVLGVVAVAQTDLKQALAASTAAQLGFVVLAAGVGAISGGTLQLIAHAATKAALFLAAGAWLTALGTKRFAGLRGIALRWPVVGIAATAAALSLAGVPPLSLWAAKDAVLAGALAVSPVLYVSGLVGAALAAAYSGRIIALLWRPAGSAAPRGEHDEHRGNRDVEQYWDTAETGTRTVTRLAQVPIAILAAAAVLLGVLALPGVRGLLPADAAPSPSALELAASAVLALVVLALVLVRVQTWTLGADWFRADAIVETLVVRPVHRFAALAAAVDDRYAAAIDGLGRAGLRVAAASALTDDRSADVVDDDVGRAGFRASHWSARVDVDGIARAVGAMAVGIGRAGRAARRTQTGRLQDYYFAVVVAIAVAIVVLLISR